MLQAILPHNGFKELFPFCLRPGQGEVTMQAFLKAHLSALNHRRLRIEGVTATARSSGENKESQTCSVGGKIVRTTCFVEIINYLSDQF